MNLKQEALEYIKQLQVLFFEQQNMSALLSNMAEESSWIGSGIQEICQSPEDKKTAFTLQKQEFSGHFSITESHYDVISLSTNSCVVYGELNAVPEDPSFAPICYRLTAVCIKTELGMRLAHIHLSNPDADQEEGHYYIKNGKVETMETLRQKEQKNSAELHRRNKQLEALTENIPGGVHQCLNDDKMTLLNMSNSFLTLLGYTQEEIKEQFHNHYLEIIYPPDLTNVQTKIKKQLSQGNIIDLEYRIMHKNGDLLWVLDQGKRIVLPNGTETFFCMIMDITIQKKEQEELRLSLERHKIIIDQTTDIIFEWDMIKDTLIFSHNWYKKFGYKAICHNITQKIPHSPNIHPDDMPYFLKIMQESAAGVPYSETEFRIRNAQGEFTWNRIRATVQYDFLHRPIKAVGVILDIDTDKKQRQQLIEQAQHDALTNLYNKTAIRDHIVRKMAESSGKNKQALIIIDIDNFKRVNDSFGHLCGDALLSDVATVLKKLFSIEEPVGRIGGDEFLIFLPDVIEKEEIDLKIKKVLSALQILKPVKEASPITCSVGIALFPQKTIDYNSLYKYADTALYQVKAAGKNNFAYYNADNCEDMAATDLIHSTVGVIDSDIDNQNDAVGEKLVQYTFRMLYNSIDVNTAVEKLLEIVGRAYDVSRVYIFESSEDGLRCSNTYEWCNTGVPPEIDNLQDLSYKEDLADYLRNFDERNIFYCQDIRKLPLELYNILIPQGIYSILQCAIMDDGVFKGYVGFDECSENRYWTKEQINSLTMIANILSTFLLKLRLKEKITSVNALENGHPKKDR